MLYTNNTGVSTIYRTKPPIEQRTIQFSPNGVEPWNETVLLEIIWQIAGNLVIEVRLRGIYYDQDIRRMLRSYELHFMPEISVDALLQVIADMLTERLGVTALKIDIDQVAFFDLDTK